MAVTKTYNETRQVVALLGGAKIFSNRINDLGDLRMALRRGFPYASFDAVLLALDFSARELAQILGVASRTLARRKTSQFLSPIESDRLYRIVQVTLQASNVLGSLEKARKWLRKENQALGGDSPISLLDTEIGEHQVIELLNRINYGILS